METTPGARADDIVGVAHEAEQDDFYRGYFIKKGTRILPLDWYVMQLFCLQKNH